jgi:GT2 family glycosyltransferase
LGSTPLVSLIIPNYNGKTLLKECLDSVQRLSYQKLETIVLDAGSTDGSADMIRTQYPFATLLETRTNRIYAACNLGMKAARGDVIVPLLNNDMTVDEHWLDHLVEALRQPEVGIVDSKVYCYGTNIISATGNMIDWNSAWTNSVGSGETDCGQYESGREIDVAELIVVRRDVAEEIGGFDEEYFFYYGDVDYCVRAKQAGYKIMYVPRALVWHRESATLGQGTPRQFYALERDGLRFLLKHSPAGLIIFRFYYRTLCNLKSLASNILIRRMDLVRAQVTGYLWNLFNMKQTMRSRAEIKLHA